MNRDELLASEELSVRLQVLLMVFTSLRPERFTKYIHVVHNECTVLHTMLVMTGVAAQRLEGMWLSIIIIKACKIVSCCWAK